jgi:hypothetical protein
MPSRSAISTSKISLAAARWKRAPADHGTSAARLRDYNTDMRLRSLIPLVVPAVFALQSPVYEEFPEDAAAMAALAPAETATQATFTEPLLAQPEVAAVEARQWTPFPTAAQTEAQPAIPQQVAQMPFTPPQVNLPRAAGREEWGTPGWVTPVGEASVNTLTMHEANQSRASDIMQQANNPGLPMPVLAPVHEMALPSPITIQPLFK